MEVEPIGCHRRQLRLAVAMWMATLPKIEQDRKFHRVRLVDAAAVVAVAAAPDAVEQAPKEQFSC